MQKERDSLTQQLKSTQQQLSALQEQYDKHVMEVQVRIAFH
jgi:flagellar capping protein FliD